MNDRLLKACRLEETDKKPVWLMRQAGRYLPEYRKLRRDRDLLSLCKDTEAAAELTALPVLKFGVDAAILFADIALPLEGLGVPFRMVDGEGPVVEKPVRDEWGVKNIREFDSSRVNYVYETIRLARSILNDRVPIIGFAGGPFTIACYIVGDVGSRDFPLARSLIHMKPRLWRELMEILTMAMAQYSKAQVEAGARVFQIFDSWAGSLSPLDYEESVLPYVKALVDEIRGRGVPVIYFTTCSAGMLELLRRTGANVIGIDWRVDIGRAWRSIGFDVGIQGNLDPAVLLGDRDSIVLRAGQIMEATRDRPGHIFNLGHGVLPETPPENVAALVEFVHGYEEDGVEH
jgi:uroporphyrinogen decarboxylase